MDSSIRDIPKKRGRKKTTGRGEGVLLRLHAPLLEPLDTWIAGQPEPRPSRSEAIRRALRDWLVGQGVLKQHEDPEGAN